MVLEGSTAVGTDADNACNLDNIAEPDNLHYVAGNLLIAEDTSRHNNAALCEQHHALGSSSS